MENQKSQDNLLDTYFNITDVKPEGQDQNMSEPRPEAIFENALAEFLSGTVQQYESLQNKMTEMFKGIETLSKQVMLLEKFVAFLAAKDPDMGKFVDKMTDQKE